MSVDVQLGGKTSSQPFLGQHLPTFTQLTLLDIQKSRDARVLQFKNYIEDREADRIGLKSNKCRDSLQEIYAHVSLR